MVPMPASTKYVPNGNLDRKFDDDWECNTDKSFEEEAQLQAIDFDMHQLALHRFRIGERYYLLDPNDEIFTAKGPCEARPPSDRCGTCMEASFADPKKDIIFC